MKTSPLGLALIQQFEGFSPVPYVCPAGLLTIGYGHVIRDFERTSLRSVDQASAQKILAADVVIAERAIGRSINAPLIQPQFDALVSFTFNLGAAALQRSTLRRAINRGEGDEIVHQWMRWVWAGGRKLPGLVRRRAAELVLYHS